MTDARSAFHTALHELVDAMRILLRAHERDADPYRRVDAMFDRALRQPRPPRIDYARLLESARAQVANARERPKSDALAQLGDAMGKVKTVLGDLHLAEPDANASSA